MTASDVGVEEDTRQQITASNRPSPHYHGDVNINITNEATEVDVESWKNADSSEYSLEGFTTPSDDYAVSDKDTASPSEALDFFQYQTPESDSDQIISDVLKGLFGESYVDPFTDRVLDDNGEVQSDQWLENRSSGGNIWNADTAATDGTPSGQNLLDRQIEITSVSPTINASVYDSNRKDEDTDYLQEASVNGTANTSDTSEQTSNNINQGGDLLARNISLDSIKDNERPVTENVTKETTKNDLYDKNRPMEYFSSWDYHDLGSYDLADGRHKVNITEDHVHVTANADEMMAESTTSKGKL